jgi:isoleucyl-tRNA synthetase
MSHKQIALLEKEGQVMLELDGKNFEVLHRDVEIMHEDIEGWLVAADETYGIMVALDTEITPELEQLGLARELVSRIQTLRKESGLAITDRIVLTMHCSPKLHEAVCIHEAYITAETLATQLTTVPLEATIPQESLEQINGEACRLNVAKA